MSKFFCIFYFYVWSKRSCLCMLSWRIVLLKMAMIEFSHSNVSDIQPEIRIINFFSLFLYVPFFMFLPLVLSSENPYKIERDFLICQWSVNFWEDCINLFWLHFFEIWWEISVNWRVTCNDAKNYVSIDNVSAHLYDIHVIDSFHHHNYYCRDHFDKNLI